MSEKKTPTSDNAIWLKEFEFNLPDDKDHWHILQTILSTVLEEYKTLRAESLQVSSLMMTVLQIGGAIAGTLFGAGAVIWGNKDVSIRNLAFPLFYFIIPYFVIFIGVLWTGEAFRYKRIGDYIVIIETKVEILLRKVYEKNYIPMAWMDIQEKIEDCLKIGKSNIELIKPLVWEQWLKATGHVRALYVFRIGLWLLLSVISPGIGSSLALLDDNFKGFFIYGVISVFFWLTVSCILGFILKTLAIHADPISVQYTNSRNIITHYEDKTPNI